jgi:hypothetical protein
VLWLMELLANGRLSPIGKNPPGAREACHPRQPFHACCVICIIVPGAHSEVAFATNARDRIITVRTSMNRHPEADKPCCGRRAAPPEKADASVPRRSMPLLAVILSACIVLPPEGPSVMVLPGSGQRFEQFRTDDAMCRNFASRAIGPRTPQSAAVDAGVASAALGTVIGAALGAAVDGSRGAAVGAGIGLLAGSSSGVAAGNASSYALQRRYDQNYVQCMYSRGHKVPLPAGYPLRDSSASRPASPAFVPPPPRGAPPPPPPPLGAPPPPPR